MNKPTIAAIIITRNEEKWIEGCLKSYYWVDEIIIVDAESNDKTVQIAKKYTKKIFKHPWDGFKNQKNRLLDHVSSDWVIAVDADERSTPQFKKAVLNAIANPEGHVAFDVQTRNVFLGREMKHGGWFPETHTRIFKMSTFKGWQGEIHEYPVFEGTIGQIHEGFIHFSHRNIAEMLEKTIRYSAIEADRFKKANFKKVTPIAMFKAIAREFYHRGIKNRGFLDGTEGWIEIIYQSFSLFISYARLWELQRKESLEKSYQNWDKTIEQLNASDKK